MLPQRSVLIVDGSDENREVLTAALQRRGCRILSASRAQRGLELAQEHHPDVIVLDMESSSASPEAFCEPIGREADASSAQLVILGNMRRPGGTLPRGEFIAKPYHYAPLIRRIEELLDAAGRPSARCA